MRLERTGHLPSLICTVTASPYLLRVRAKAAPRASPPDCAPAQVGEAAERSYTRRMWRALLGVAGGEENQAAGSPSGGGGGAAAGGASGEELDAGGLGESGAGEGSNRGGSDGGTSEAANRRAGPLFEGLLEREVVARNRFLLVVKPAATPGASGKAEAEAKGAPYLGTIQLWRASRGWPLNFRL